ncbi:MAG: hypothetical protein WBI53_09440, partial [Paludibacter sp.]
MTEPTVATKGSNSNSLGNSSRSFLLPESELRHPALLPRYFNSLVQVIKKINILFVEQIISQCLIVVKYSTTIFI